MHVMRARDVITRVTSYAHTEVTHVALHDRVSTMQCHCSAHRHRICNTAYDTSNMHAHDVTARVTLHASIMYAMHAYGMVTRVTRVRTLVSLRPYLRCPVPLVAAQ